MFSMEWSVSQSHQYNECPRSWYLQRRSAEGDRLRVRPVPLKSLIGIAVHKGIAEQIGLWRDGKEVSALGAEEIGLTYISRIWAQKESTITEFVNGVVVENNTRSRMEDAMHQRIATFFNMFWPHLSKYQYVTHETLDSFLIQGVKMWVQVDLATRDSMGGLLVSDWKTGQGHHNEADSHQMVVYALWANKKFEPDPDRIHTQVVNLRTGQVDRRTMNVESLAETEQRLDEEIARVSEAVRGGNFVAIPSLEKCISCGYLSLCNEGSSTVQGSRSQSVNID